MMVHPLLNCANQTGLGCKVQLNRLRMVVFFLKLSHQLMQILLIGSWWMYMLLCITLSHSLTFFIIMV